MKTKTKEIRKILEEKKLLYYNLYINCGNQVKELEKRGKNMLVLSTGLKFSLDEVKYLEERYSILFEEYKNLIEALKKGGLFDEQ